MISPWQLVGCSWLLGFMLLGATELSAQSVATVVFRQEVANQSNVIEDIEELRKKTIGLQKQLNENAIVEPQTGSEVPESDLNSSDSQKVVEIRKNLELLRQVIKDKRAKALAEATQRSQQKAILQSPLELDAPQQESAEITQNGSDANVGVRMPKKVLDKIVNAFELGNSLFLAGNIEQAIKYYEFVPVERLSAAERNWLEFMLASCHQRNRDFELAEAGFRTVAGFKDSPRLSQSAKESLKYVVSRKRLAGVVDEYSSRADDVLQKANALIGETADGK